MGNGRFGGVESLFNIACVEDCTLKARFRYRTGRADGRIDGDSDIPECRSHLETAQKLEELCLRFAEEGE